MLYGKVTAENKSAAYLRLSREDDDRFESNSITGQKELIRDFVSKNHDLHLVDFYIDDGYTGTNYERPGFKKMLQDIETNKVNCVIVKDLSRLGRNYIETGKFIERIFPALGVRFISVNDHYDSNNEHSDADEILIPFKNLLNDAYCRDMSLKVRSQLAVKRKSGQYIGSFPAYGYKKDPKNKNHLIIDEEPAKIVQKIFNWKLEGYNQKAIAAKLNELGVETPLLYKQHHGSNYNSGFRAKENPVWESVNVRRILQNEVYTGTVVQGKTEKVNYKIKKQRDIDEKDWVRVPNMHDAIISHETFEAVQRLFKTDTRTSPLKTMVYPLSGICKCGHCGHNMTIRGAQKAGGKYYSYYHCITVENGKPCGGHLINTQKLSDVVLKEVQVDMKLFAEAAKVIDISKQTSIAKITDDVVSQQINTLTDEITRYKTLKASLYKDLHSGVVSEAEYNDMNNMFMSKINQLESSIKTLENKRLEKINQPADYSWVEFFTQFNSVKEMDRKTAVSLIERINVYDKKHVEIVYVHNDEIREMIRLYQTKEYLKPEEQEVTEQ